MSDKQWMLLIEKLGRCEKGLVMEVKDLPIGWLTYRVRPNAWSVGEIVHHLILTQQQICKAYQKLQAANANQRPGEKGPQKGQTLVQRISYDSFLRFSKFSYTLGKIMKVKAPRPVRPSIDGIDSRILGQFAGARAQLVTLTEKLITVQMGHVTAPHPLFGELNVWQWLDFVGSHEIHHIEQIKERKKALVRAGKNASK